MYLFSSGEGVWFKKEIFPEWDEARSTLILKFYFNPVFSRGIYRHGCIDERYYVKKRDLPMLKGMGGNEIFYLQSERRFREVYWARLISLYEPTPPKETISEVIFQLHGRKLSFAEALLLKRIIYTLEDGVGVVANQGDCSWSISPPFIGFSNEKKTVLPVPDFHHFAHKYFRALDIMGPLPEYPSLDFLKEIYQYWGEKSIPLSRDVAMGLEILVDD